MEEEPVVALEISEKEGKWDRKNIYKPLLKILPEIVKGLKEKDLWVPLSTIARLEIQGKMDEPRHELVRAQVVHFLKRSNRYKKVYVRLMEKSRHDFHKNMRRSGIYQPQMKEYRSLSVSIPLAFIFNKDKKSWIYSFDAYLPDILYRSNKKKAKPPTGSEMVERITAVVAKDLEEIEKFRKISLKFAKILKADIKMANKSPTSPYRSWHKRTGDKNDEDGMYYFKYKVRSKPMATEAVE